MGLRGARSSAVPAATDASGGFLRGSRKLGVPRGVRYIDPAVASRFRYIEAQLRRQRQELTPFRPSTTALTSTVAPDNRHDVNITNVFTSSAIFDEYILGDRFNNKHLTVKWATESAAIPQLRLIIYRSKKAGNVIGSLPNSYVDLVDQAAFMIYWDKVYQPNSGSSLMSDQVNIPLNFQTLVNRAGPNIEQGELRMLFVWRSTTAEQNLDYNYRLIVQNK